MGNLTGNELRRRRQELRLTQRDLAEQMEVHMRTISKWERGVNAIPRWVGLVLYGLELRRDLSRADRRRAAGPPADRQEGSDREHLD